MLKIITHKITIGILLSILCFIGAVGMYRLIPIALKRFGPITFYSTGSRNELVEDLLYLGTVTFIPFVFIILWDYAPVRSVKKRLLSLLATIVCLVLALWLRFISIKSTVGGQTKFIVKSRDNEPLPARLFFAEQLHLWMYILPALVIGCTITYLLLRDRNRDIPSFSFESGKE